MDGWTCKTYSLSGLRPGGDNDILLYSKIQYILYECTLHTVRAKHAYIAKLKKKKSVDLSMDQQRAGIAGRQTMTLKR